jgi:hypothetical protein
VAEQDVRKFMTQNPEPAWIIELIVNDNAHLRTARQPSKRRKPAMG